MKTIGIYYHSYLYAERGGVARVSNWLAAHLMASGYKIVSITPRGRQGLTCNGAICVELSKPYDCEIRKIVQAYGIDLIINQSSFYKSAMALGYCKCPVITVVHYNPCPMPMLEQRKKLNVVGNWKGKLWARLYNAFPWAMSWISAIIAKRVERTVFGFSKAVVVLAKSYVSRFEKPGKRFNVPVLAIANPNPFAGQCNRTTGEKIVIYVGRLTRMEKRLDWLLEIWKRTKGKSKDWKLILVGEGEDRENLERIVNDTEINVEFAGRSDPRWYYEQASLIALSSPSEGFPMVLPEAMSYGVVPILFDSFGAAHDIVEDGKTGFLVPPYDLDAYAAKLRQVMSMDLEPMRDAVIAKANEFSGDKIFAEWKKLIEGILDQRPEARDQSN